MNSLLLPASFTPAGGSIGAAACSGYRKLSTGTCSLSGRYVRMQPLGCGHACERVAARLRRLGRHGLARLGREEVAPRLAGLDPPVVPDPLERVRQSRARVVARSVHAMQVLLALEERKGPRHAIHVDVGAAVFGERSHVRRLEPHHGGIFRPVSGIAQEEEGRAARIVRGRAAPGEDGSKATQNATAAKRRRVIVIFRQ